MISTALRFFMLGPSKIQSRAGRSITAHTGTVIPEAGPSTITPLGEVASSTAEGLPKGHLTSQASNLLPRYVCKSRFIVKQKFHSFGRSITTFLPQWQSLTSDPWVLNFIQGYHPLLMEPCQSRIPSTHNSETQASLMDEEVKEMKQKEAVHVHNSHSRDGICQFPFPSSQKGRRSTPSD